MRSKWYFLVVGLAMVLGPSLANSQFGQPGGGNPFGGGGRGRGAPGGAPGGVSFDPTQMWNMMAPGKEVVTQADAASNPMLQRTFDRAIQTLGITNGQLTRDQFVGYMQQRMAGRGGANTQGMPGAAPGGAVVAMPGGMTPGGPGGNFGRNGGGNPFGGGGNPFGGGGNGGGWGGGNFDPDMMAEMRFRRMDLDGDGKLNYDEMDDALKAERDRWDTNNDGFIDLNEFKEYFKARIAQYQQAGGPGGPGGPNGALPEERKATVYRAGKLPPNLPAWFAQYDTDLDGQIGLYEWKAAGQPIAQFEKMDTNGDGFLTVEEVLRATGALVAKADPNSPGANPFGPGGFGGGRGGNRGMGGGGGGGRGGNRGMGGGNNPMGGMGGGGRGGQGGNPFGGNAGQGGNPFGGNAGQGGGRGGRGQGGGGRGQGGGGTGGGNPFGGGGGQGGIPGANPTPAGPGGAPNGGNAVQGGNPFGGGGGGRGRNRGGQ